MFGQALNRLCYPSLNIKRRVLAPVSEKSKEKWSDFRQGCIQVLDLSLRISFFVSWLFCMGSSSLSPEGVPSSSSPISSQI